VPNFSEGRRKEVIDAIRSAAENVVGITILDCESDPNHNRMVLTFVGGPEAVFQAALAASEKAIALIDLTKHVGEHPRMGAVDVVPFVPLREVSMQECVELANQFAKEFASRFSVPVFLYERAATREERRNLANVREGQFEGLRELIGKDPSRDPDYGPNAIHPTAGATAVGARPVLIAYNVDLDSTDISLAKRIAKKMRERDGGFPAVKALGFELKDRNLVQVSMNLTDYTKTSMHTVYDAITQFASEGGVKVADSEIVGLVPQEALAKASVHYLKLKDFRQDQIIENRIFSENKEAEPAGSDWRSTTLEQFSKSISSVDPVPGGGSASAYAGTLSASLVGMVCRLTTSKKSYAEVQQQVKDILEKIEPLRDDLLQLVNRDSQAYSLVSSAMKLPKDSESQKSERKAKIKEALKLSTEVPSETILKSYEVFKLAKAVREIGYKNAASDAQTAIELSRAAILGAWSNVKINLEGLAEEPDYVDSVKFKLSPIVKEVAASIEI
jgi:glutamate formiminotransferase / formiminotetrahydrofolate cyclodeaminase